MDNETKIRELRQLLHKNPEASNHETKTKKILMDFIKENTRMRVFDCGKGFYAAYRRAEDAQEGIALRADYDALQQEDGSCAHLCGHDGNASALCYVALMLEERKPKKNVFLLFQPAEETGDGAKECVELFRMEKVDAIYGCHTLPGFEFGKIYTKTGTFACGSEGMILEFRGTPAHAAYPENGISPALATAQILLLADGIPETIGSKHLLMITVIGVKMGEKAFGSSAADAQIWLTLRAEKETELKLIHNRILEEAERLSKQFHLDISYEIEDAFPATENHEEQAKHVLSATNGTTLDKPMRWSEDFGHYLKYCKGAYFGIGAGIDHPDLHTISYEYPDDLLRPTAEAFMNIILK